MLSLIINSWFYRLFHPPLHWIMKFILSTLTLFLSTALADLISDETGQTLKCYGSNGWKNLESVKFEKEQCGFSRCYAATSKNFFKAGVNLPKLSYFIRHSLNTNWLKLFQIPGHSIISSFFCYFGVPTR